MIILVYTVHKYLVLMQLFLNPIRVSTLMRTRFPYLLGNEVQFIFHVAHHAKIATGLTDIGTLLNRLILMLYDVHS